ncbi:hypothetical protein QBC47DRAFT_459684 [Echria macrotheca]|uniref:Heterokaryon incompatibility domain-containing protein n=1 Tax=Echria macrotheca TaxID=438768 RepID=A0AAJ0F7M8_9PEZI|nr:hypothetical protein QBC47DRAFT_459684 [Echria macrotheca]
MSTSLGETASSMDPGSDNAAAHADSATQPDQKVPRYVVVHRVECSGMFPVHSRHPETALFLDEPRLFKHDTMAAALRGREPLQETDWSQDPNIGFVIHRIYSCTDYQQRAFEGMQGATGVFGVHGPEEIFLKHDIEEPATPEREYMEIHSDHLRKGIETALRRRGFEGSPLDRWESEHNMLAPYLYFYHVRSSLREAQGGLENIQRVHVALLVEYLEQRFGPEYDEAENLFRSGFVTREHIHKLFGPRQVLITKEGGHLVTIETKTCPLPHSMPIRLDCKKWSFDGRFRKNTEKVLISFPRGANNRTPLKIKLDSLAAYPLKWADPQIRKRIFSRGETLLTFHQPRLVEYAPNNEKPGGPTAGRYMIATEENSITDTPEDIEEYLDLYHEKESPNLINLMPPTVRGFSFQEQKWRTLSVEYIRNVEWDTQSARTYLQVALGHTKLDFFELLAPLKPSVGAASQMGDRFFKRGTYRVALLSGPTAAGINTAAESIAEMMEAPLYRVTAGDIQAYSGERKRYIELVFQRADIWEAVQHFQVVSFEDCEQYLSRHSSEHESIYQTVLKLLETYNGLVIVTTHFEITLALSVVDLGEEQRRELWTEIYRTQLKPLMLDGLDVQNEIRELSTAVLTWTEIRNLARMAQDLAMGQSLLLTFDDISRICPMSQVELEWRKSYTRTANSRPSDMRLIHTTTFELKQFFGLELPKYAILSHMWGTEEVSYQDWAVRSEPDISRREGYLKIASTCELAREEGYDYLWVDTNCIDKSSSAELTEAINSMFEWYRQADICYAYLADIETSRPLTGGQEIRSSRWFRRGWTLQELLAPRRVNLYAADWSFLGTRSSLARHISAATGISLRYLHSDAPRGKEKSSTRSNDAWDRDHDVPIHAASVAERMAWLSRRETTRIEDMAYCALGIFGIHMALIYGEGPNAFARLQEEIIRVSADQSLFCWSWGVPDHQSQVGLLSPRPQAFLGAARYTPRRQETTPQPYTLTNAGLAIRLPLLRSCSSHNYIGVLGVESTRDEAPIGIYLSGDRGTSQFARQHYPDVPIPLCRKAGEIWDTATDTSAMKCRVGCLLTLDFDSSDFKFGEPASVPSSRIRYGPSILELCRQERSDPDWNPYFSDQTADGLRGAAIVDFTVRIGLGHRIETILFVASSSTAGNFLESCWRVYYLTNLFDGRGVPNEIKSFMEDTTAGTEGVDLKSTAVIRRCMADTTPSDMGLDSGRWVDVHKATHGFLTTTGSMLMHMHIAPRLDIWFK